jgi:CheY-like chemotaxis protein
LIAGFTSKPVIAITHNTHHDINHVFAAGAADYITPGETGSAITQKVDQYFAAAEIDTAGTAHRAVQLPHDLKVLLVEDDTLLQTLLSDKFQESGVRFTVCKDGGNVKNLAVTFQPSVIILDLMLPVVNGFEVLTQLKNHPHQSVRNIPVIAFTNKDTQVDRKKAADLGAVDFRVKALTDLDDLIDLIKAHTS